VVINKVLPDKFAQTKKYMTALLKENWGVPLIGCVPDKAFLGCPALADLEKLFNTKLLAGEEHRMRHYNTSEVSPRLSLARLKTICSPSPLFSLARLKTASSITLLAARCSLHAPLFPQHPAPPLCSH